MEEVAQDYVTLARHLATSNDFGHALSMYVCAFSREPKSVKILENEYQEVLAKMNEELGTVENKAAIFAKFTKFPGNLDLLIDIGSCLYRYGYMSEALKHLEKALNIDSSYVSVEKNMNNVKTALFPKNQFRILNDKIRNNAYRAAIRNSVTASDSVINIETGTGLLALYANECNPVAITACKTSTEMARLSECVMQDNNAQEVIVMHRSLLNLKWSDIYLERSVLICDLIDSGLFGENILQYLCHAWENFLLPTCRIIPGRAEYFVAGVKCDELSKKYKLCQHIKKILNVTHMNVHPTTTNGQAYCSEDVYLYENLKYMCEPKSLFLIDFSCYEDVHEKLHRQEPYYAELTAIEEGEIDMLIGWFNLYLTDDIMLTSDPKSIYKVDAYEQAVFFDTPSRKVSQDEIINIPFLISGGRLTTAQDANTAITRISLESIAYLNDTEFINMVRESVVPVCNVLSHTVMLEQVDIVDLSPFPLFGILMLRKGANSLTCYAKTVDDEAFLQIVLVANGIPKNKVTVLMGENWSLDVFGDKKYHVIYSQILELNGDINIRWHWVIQHLKHFNLCHGGVCLPSSITVMGQIIYSDYFNINNAVIDDNVDYSLASRVHRYRVSQVMDLDIASLDYEAFSDVFEVAFDELSSHVVKVPMLKNGECNAILCWYKVKLMDDGNEIYTNRRNSFVRSSAYMTGHKSPKVYIGDTASVIKCIDPVSQSNKLIFYIVPSMFNNCKLM